MKENILPNVSRTKYFNYTSTFQPYVKYSLLKTIKLNLTLRNILVKTAHSYDNWFFITFLNVSDYLPTLYFVD